MIYVFIVPEERKSYNTKGVWVSPQGQKGDIEIHIPGMQTQWFFFFQFQNAT